LNRKCSAWKQKTAAAQTISDSELCLDNLDFVQTGNFRLQSLQLRLRKGQVWYSRMQVETLADLLGKIHFVNLNWKI